MVGHATGIWAGEMARRHQGRRGNPGFVEALRVQAAGLARYSDADEVPIATLGLGSSHFDVVNAAGPVPNVDQGLEPGLQSQVVRTVRCSSVGCVWQGSLPTELAIVDSDRVLEEGPGQLAIVDSDRVLEEGPGQLAIVDSDRVLEEGPGQIAIVDSDRVLEEGAGSRNEDRWKWKDEVEAGLGKGASGSCGQRELLYA